MHARAPGDRGPFRSILGVASLALVSFLVIAGFRGYHDLEVARQREARLEEQIAETRREVERLERRIDRLRNDPAMLERLAREELGLARPGEVVILMEPERPLAGRVVE